MTRTEHLALVKQFYGEIESMIRELEAETRERAVGAILLEEDSVIAMTVPEVEELFRKMYGDSDSNPGVEDLRRLLQLPGTVVLVADRDGTHLYSVRKPGPFTNPWVTSDETQDVRFSAGYEPSERVRAVEWTPEMDTLIRAAPVEASARELGLNVTTIRRRRRALRVAR